jgi:hypothetical protein
MGGKRAGEECNVALQDGSKGAKHPYLSIELAVPQVIEKVIQNLREKLGVNVVEFPFLLKELRNIMT